MEVKDLEFSIATSKDKKNILNYYMELDSESTKISRIMTCDSEVLDGWIEDEFVNLYILYEGQTIVSLIKANCGKGDQSHSSCLNISTRQDFRNRGYAKRLIEYVINELKEKKILIVRVKIFSWNKPAIATIEKSDFTLSGRIVMSHYDEDYCDYIDDLLYHKFL